MRCHLLLLSAVLALGCTVITETPDRLCGPGTELVGDTCVAADGTVVDPGTPGDDLPPGDGTEPGATEPPARDPGTDPVGGERPGDGYGGAGEGCDAASGECEAWRDALVDEVIRRQIERGCAPPAEVDPRIQEIAQAHADEQAAADTLDTSSSEAIARAVFEAGVELPRMGIAYSQTSEGPDDVIARWLDGGASRNILQARCDLAIGAGVATSDTGWSYVTLIVADVIR